MEKVSNVKKHTQNSVNDSLMIDLFIKQTNALKKRILYQTNLWHFKSQDDIDKINEELWADLPRKERVTDDGKT
jgi:hypothetical protein